jgi:hypothetical protein
MLSTGMVEEVGVAGVGAALGVVATGPGGRGSLVALLAEPGSTACLESAMEGFSAKVLCNHQGSVSIVVPTALHAPIRRFGRTLLTEAALTACAACH